MATNSSLQSDPQYADNKDQFIRTMKSDLENLKNSSSGLITSDSKTFQKQTAPPRDLPVDKPKSIPAIESIRPFLPPKPPAPQPITLPKPPAFSVPPQASAPKPDIFSKPIKPIVPPVIPQPILKEKISALQPEVKKIIDKKDISKAPKSGKILKLSLGIAVIIILAAAGFFIYKKIQTRPPIVQPSFHYECKGSFCVQLEGAGDNSCQIDDDCQKLPEPSSIVKADDYQTINLKEDELLIDKIKAFNSPNSPIGALEAVFIKLASVASPARYLNFNEVSSGLGIVWPEGIINEIAEAGNNYNLFAYKQTSEKIRLGLIIALSKDLDVDDFLNKLKNWEQSIISDLNPIFLQDITSSDEVAFNKNIYKNTDIYYMNFPTPDLSIDYALFTKHSNNYLVLATSRESAYKLVDQLVLEFDARCDANNPCPSGKECYKFEDVAYPVCFAGDLCQRCPSKSCFVLESYPVQVKCQ